MRKHVVAAMSGLSAAVLGLSLHHSQQGALAATAAPVGLVSGPSTAPTETRSPAASERPRIPPTAPASARPNPTVSPTAHPPTVAAVHAPPSAAVPAARPTPKTITVNGAPADTQYGPVQVQLTLRGGHIVRAEAIAYPQGGGRDQQINSQAIPQLDSETVQADSAQIDTVSGATYTSDGYRQSLQSALDAAHQAGGR